MRILISAILAGGMPFVAACKTTKAASDVKGGFVGEPGGNDTGTYIVDWPCFPKRYGTAAEKDRNIQDEYCEWTKVKTEADKAWCVFTSSFDTSREIHLVQSNNTLGAAVKLVKDCQKQAQIMLKQAGNPGQKCEGMAGGCVAGRNSDPEICSHVRDLVARAMDPSDNVRYRFPALSQPQKKLIQFGLLAPLPAGCEAADPGEPEGITMVGCPLPSPEASCVDSFAKKLRVGMEVEIAAGEPQAGAAPDFGGGTRDDRGGASRPDEAPDDQGTSDFFDWWN
jgi:hypothetical protein